MKSPCIAYPEDEPIVLIRASQVRICEGNHCAAALLSYFGYWHDNRAGNVKQAEHANKMAALHGETGVQDMTLLQYHTEEEIEAGLLHLYGRKTIRAAIAFLTQKGFVSLHRNPNPRYRFDRTHYFLFHPTLVAAEIGVPTHEVKMPDREMLEETMALETESTTNSSQVLDISDQVKLPDREGIFAASSGKSAAPITEITNREEEIPSVLAKAKTSPQGGEEKEKKRSRTKASQHPNTDYTPGFNKFWALYQRKERKVDAFEIWRTRDLDARAPEIAEKIARLQVTLWRHKDPQYIPLPTTWLNEARYEDDLVPLDTVTSAATHPQSFSWAEQQRQREVDAARTFAGVPHARPTGPTTICDSDDTVIEGVTYHRVND